MNSVIIITRKSIDSSKIYKKYVGKGFIVSRSGNRLVVEGRSGWFALEPDDSLLRDYDEGEIDVLKQSFPDGFSLAQLEFNDIESANHAILHMEIPGDSLVDNDHGLILNINNIINFINTATNWSVLEFLGSGQESRKGGARMGDEGAKMKDASSIDNRTRFAPPSPPE